MHGVQDKPEDDGIHNRQLEEFANNLKPLLFDGNRIKQTIAAGK